MSTDPDALRDIFLEVSDETVLTERQEEGIPHDPIGEREAELEADVSGAALEDGLDDAVDMEFTESESIAG